MMPARMLLVMVIGRAGRRRGLRVVEKMRYADFLGDIVGSLQVEVVFLCQSISRYIDLKEKPCDRLTVEYLK